MSSSDVDAIKALRARDETASKAGDFATLRSIMSDDAVVLPPGGRAKVGKAELDATFAKLAGAPKTHEVLEYRFEFSEPEIVGNIALEYGSIVGTMRNLTDGVVSSPRYNALRVLRKEGGQWRVYRTMWALSG
jgi:ketosteroid isomerase-like protein